MKSSYINLQAIWSMPLVVVLLSGCKWKQGDHINSWRSGKSVAYTLLTENDAPWLGLRALEGRILRKDIERLRFVQLDPKSKSRISENVQMNLKPTLFGTGILLGKSGGFILTKDTPQILFGLWNGKGYSFWLAGKEASGEHVVYFCEYHMLVDGGAFIDHTGGPCYSNSGFEEEYEELLKKYEATPEKVQVNTSLLDRKTIESR